MSSLSFTAANDSLWKEYDELATRSYGHPIGDVTHLRPYADLRVATRGGKVVAGGLGLLLPQFFGGRPVPSACLAAGCVAPEERGEHLTVRMVTERLRPLQEQGAVISTMSTTSNGYARRVGWEAPTTVFAWSIAIEDLKRSFENRTDDFEITYGLAADCPDLQHDLALQWNGPVSRPHWWPAWQRNKHALTTYCFRRAGHQTTGLLSFTMKRHERHGTTLVVHDFWARDANTASAMFVFLGRYNSRAATVDFRRGALPPAPVLLHNLHRYRPTAQAWHPWMLRILDAPQAVKLRGWPADLDATIPIGIENDSGTLDRYLLQITDGSAELSTTALTSKVSLTRRQLAVWYAGGYRTATAARLAGVHAETPEALTMLIRTTAEREPWLPDHF